jgi:hypothetical protein
MVVLFLYRDGDAVVLLMLVLLFYRDDAAAVVLLMMYLSCLVLATGHELWHDVDGHGENDGAVVLSWDAVEGLQVPQLHTVLIFNR